MQEKSSGSSETGFELAQLAAAAELGCPASAARLIERARRCGDPSTVALAERAAQGDAEAKVELIEKMKSFGHPKSDSVDPLTTA